MTKLYDFLRRESGSFSIARLSALLHRPESVIVRELVELKNAGHDIVEYEGTYRLFVPARTDRLDGPTFG